MLSTVLEEDSTVLDAKGWLHKGVVFQTAPSLPLAIAFAIPLAVFELEER